MSLIPAGTTVTVETKYFPPLTVDLGGADTAGPGLKGYIGKALKPRVTLKVGGTTLATSTPYGTPDPNKWNVTKIVLAVVAGLAVFSILRIIK